MKHLNTRWISVSLAVVSLALLSACASSQKNDYVEQTDKPLDVMNAAMKKCFDSAKAQGRAGEPADPSETEVSVGIAPSGKVTSVTVIRSTTNSPRLDKCVVETVRRAKYAKDPNGRARDTTFVYKFNSATVEGGTGESFPAQFR